MFPKWNATGCTEKREKKEDRMREASGAQSPGADWCVLVSVLVLSLSEQLMCSRDGLANRGGDQELVDDRQCVWLWLSKHPGILVCLTEADGSINTKEHRYDLLLVC